MIYLLCKNIGFPNRAFHILIPCTLTSVLGALTPSIMVMASVVVLIVVFVFYGEDHLTHPSKCWFMTMRKDFLVSKSLLLMPQFLFLMFLPYQSDDNGDEYQAILGKIQAISYSYDSRNIFIVGYFNADLTKTSLFSPFLNSFISECHFIPSDIKYLPPDAFTYVSDAHGSRSWLDHVLCTHSSHSYVSDMVINYDCVSSDHFHL